MKVNWAIPWSTPEAINAVFLGVATLAVGSVPLVYLWKANLRDPLARAILAGTGATALAFTLTFIFLMAYHLGWNPSEMVWHWIARFTYIAVAFGETLFAVALVRVIRGREK